MTRVGNLLPETFARLLPEAVITRRVNWIEVARKDLTDARRSWLLWTLCGLFIVLLLLLLIPHVVLVGPGISFGLALAPVVFGTRFLVPLTGLVVGAMAVVGEREARSIRMLLGLPVTRRDVVVGKLLGRSVVLVVTLLVALSIAGTGVWYLSVDFSIGAYAIFVSQVLVYGLLFVAMGVGFSALFRSRARVTGASVGGYALVAFVWHVVPAGIYYLVEGQFPENAGPLWDPPAWFVFFGNVNPVNGYFAVFNAWAPEVYSKKGTLEYRHHVVEGVDPFYLQPEFLLVVMLLWGVVPLIFGAWRFSRSDLA